MQNTFLNELISRVQSHAAHYNAPGDALSRAAKELSAYAHEVMHHGVPPTILVRQLAEVHTAASTLAACRSDGSIESRQAQETLTGIALLCDRRGTELALLRALVPVDLMETVRTTLMTHY